MSFEDGWAAIHLQAPRRIPRTEYSAQMHWDLIHAVTGIPVTTESSEVLKQQGISALYHAWNYDFFWNTLIGDEELGRYRTDMGHAEYAAGGVDRRDTIFSPFQSPEDVLAFDPAAAMGRPNEGMLIRRFEDHYQQAVTDHPDGVNMTGIYITLLSGLIGLFGWENLLLAAGTDPVDFGRLTNRYAAWIQQYFNALANADVPAVMIHDDFVWSSGAIFRPSWYREYIFPNYKKFVEPLVESGKKVMFCSDGDFTHFIDDVAEAGVHGFVFEPMTSLERIAEKYGRTHVIIGNVDTRILLSGPKEAIRTEVERCMRIGKDCPGFFLAVGNHIPPNTPVENALYYNAVYEEWNTR